MKSHRCPKCGETFPRTPEFFYRQSANSDGMVGHCKLDLLEKTPVCPCCDRQFDYIYYMDGKRHDAAPSVDRIVPSLGYTTSNIAIICWRCNEVKHDATLSELRLIVRWLSGMLESALPCS